MNFLCSLCTKNTVPGIRIIFVHRRHEKRLCCKKEQLKQRRAKLSAVSSPFPCQMNISWRKTQNAHIPFGSHSLTQTLYSIHCETFESELFSISFRIRNFHEKNGTKTQTVAKKEKILTPKSLLPSTTVTSLFAYHLIQYNV